MTTIVISSGHGKYVRGASGYIDEVDEARRVVERVAECYRRMGVTVHVFHDDESTTQSENLDAIVDYHNSKQRELDISVHFNCYDGSAQGTEVLYITQDTLAGKVSAAIASAGGFVDRGPKYRSDLAFLNGTEQPAILIETCFCDSRTDTELYEEHFAAICRAIAESTTGRLVALPPDAPEAPERPELPNGVYPKLRGEGAASWFGGPEDTGVSPDEGLAFIYSVDDAPYLFLPYQPEGTSGLARRLDPQVFYIAMRWDYSVY